MTSVGYIFVQHVIDLIDSIFVDFKSLFAEIKFSMLRRHVNNVLVTYQHSTCRHGNKTILRAHVKHD